MRERSAVAANTPRTARIISLPQGTRGIAYIVCLSFSSSEGAIPRAVWWSPA